MPEAAAQIVQLLAAARRVLITTHVRPDGDAIGSAVGLSLLLESRGVESQILLHSELPARFEFLTSPLRIPPAVFDTNKHTPDWFKTFEAIAVVDTGTWSQLPDMQTLFEGFGRPIVVIDHHRTQEAWANVRWVDAGRAACGEMIAELFDIAGVTISRHAAAAIFVAISTDTGFFQYSNTTPGTHRLAARLLETGIDHDAIVQRLNQSEPAARLLLMRRALKNLELKSDGQLAVMKLTPEDFTESGAGPADTENFVNIPMQVATVEASLFAALAPGTKTVRMSLRSKGRFDCSKFAERYSGGGHARAAGMKFDEPLDVALAKVVAALEAQVAAATR